MCSAVCECHGLLAYAIEDKSFNKEKFASFLSQIKAACGENDDIYLFLDNSSVHKSHVALKAMKDLNISVIWNIPYSP